MSTTEPAKTAAATRRRPSTKARKRLPTRHATTNAASCSTPRSRGGAGPAVASSLLISASASIKGIAVWHMDRSRAGAGGFRPYVFARLTTVVAEPPSGSAMYAVALNCFPVNIPSNDQEVPGAHAGSFPDPDNEPPGYMYITFIVPNAGEGFEIENPLGVQGFGPLPAGSVNACGPGAVQPKGLPVIAAVKRRVLPRAPILSVNAPLVSDVWSCHVPVHVPMRTAGLKPRGLAAVVAGAATSAVSDAATRTSASERWRRTRNPCALRSSGGSPSTPTRST